MPKNPRRLAVALLLSFTPSLTSARALAQGGAQSAPDPTLQAARARFSEGVDFYDKGQFENARASFLQAYALHKHPAVLINLAQSSLRSGHPLDADRYFTRYMHDSPSLTGAQRAAAEKGLAEARTKLGRIEVSAPAGSAVSIDGEVVGADGPTASDVEPGSHTVKGAGETTSVTVAAGQTVPVKLGKSAAVVAPILLTPEPPPMPAPVPPSDEPGPTPPVAPPPSDSGPGLLSRPETLTPVIVGAGVSVVGFVTAIILGVSKSSAQNSYDSQVSIITEKIGMNAAKGACVHPASNLAMACSALSSDGSDVNTDATVANVGIAAGVIGAGFAVGWYLFAPKAGATENHAAAWPHVEPIVGPRVGGLSIGGAF
jgi:hypothetical protein